MDDTLRLVKRLRGLADCDARSGEPLGKCMREAADVIERQRAELMKLYHKTMYDIIEWAEKLPEDA